MFPRTTELPKNVIQELKELQKITAPFMKKVATYMFWSFPLIAISIFNLVVSIFFIPASDKSLVMMLIYAIAGSIGLALQKEVKLQRQEIQKMSADYILRRVQKSEVVAPAAQNRYMSLVREEPMMAVQHFIAFLEEEARQQRMQKFHETQE